MSCELLTPYSYISPLQRDLSLSTPVYPHIIYHNKQWIPTRASNLNLSNLNTQADSSSLLSLQHPTQGSAPRRASLHRTASEYSRRTGDIKPSGKRPKLTKSKRISLPFFNLNKMLGSDRKSGSHTRSGLCCASAEKCSAHSEITSISEDYPDDVIHRSVSDNSEDVVMFRRRRPAQVVRQRPLSVSTVSTYKERSVPCISNKRPLSCYVKSQASSPPKEDISLFQKKFRRLSATVKNFSLEKLMHQRKMSAVVKSAPSLEERNEKRKSLPCNFRFADGELTFATPSVKRKARSLHDDLPDGPALAHQALSGEKNSFKRSNSLELDDSHTSGIRRTPSDRSADCDSDIVLREPSKAKSITEQLERYGLYGLTQFDTQFENKREEFNIELESSWQDIVSIEAQNSLTNREKEQQEAIWELFSTEYNYLNNLSTCVKTFLNCLRKLKHEKFLSDINVEDLFLNIELIYEINLKFWKDCLEPCLIEARQTQNPLNPHLITEGYICDDRFYPYLEYCLKHQERIIYLDSKMKKQNDFKEYISWCENQLRSTTRLGLKDMLVKPFQRITKYPLLFKCILKKTQDEDTSTALKSMLDKIVSFVQSLNRQMQQKEDERSLKDVMSKIEGYNVFSPPTSTHGNERIDQILSQYNKLDLLSPVPVLGSQRRFLGESSSKMSTFQDRPFECHLFLFNDLLLITKPAKKRDKKYTIVKQPMSLDPDKLKITELEEHQNSILLVYLNEFGSAVDSFLLSSSSRESHLSFLNSISTAQDKFKEQKIKTLTEIDSSKSHLSNMSMESYTSSPDQNHLRLGCSITRSSSENYNRRTDTSTSVARAQSMPASNDRRLHNDPCLASSSSASSSETSGSLLSVDSSAKSSSVALSEIKENDYMASDLSIQNLDESGDENTVISDTKCESYTDNRTDNYISDNLCSDLKFKIDIDKTVLVDNDVKNQDIFNIGTEKL